MPEHYCLASLASAIAAALAIFDQLTADHIARARVPTAA